MHMNYYEEVVRWNLPDESIWGYSMLKSSLQNVISQKQRKKKNFLLFFLADFDNKFLASRVYINKKSVFRLCFFPPIIINNASSTFCKKFSEVWKLFGETVSSTVASSEWCCRKLEKI